MPDCDGRYPAFGLRGLARIADDEWVEDRQCPDDGIRKARRCERHGFAGEPFQRAVGAHMDQRISPEDVSQPQPECHQGMARWQRRIVIIGPSIIRTPAVGRQRHNDITVDADAKQERTIAHVRIVGRIAPRIVKACCQFARQIGQELRIGGER
jgi:hypothetical protein